MASSGKEIKLSNIKSILSRTDLKGKIEYVNSYFVEISGYSEAELVGSSHNIIRHPDMPKVIFKWMWQRIKKNQDILALVKNRAKNGDYYWVTTLFETKYHPFTKKPEGYLAIRRAPSKNAIHEIEPLYEKLLKIEKEESLEASEEYLIDFLKKQNKSYDAYVQDITEHKGIAIQFFNAMRKIVS
jgi:PAS domain S-box-containing protein